MNENLYIAHKNLPHKTLRVHSAFCVCVGGVRGAFMSLSKLNGLIGLLKCC